MEGEAFDVRHLYPLDFMAQPPVYGAAGGGGSPIKFIVNTAGYVAGVVVFSSSTIASMISGHFVQWDDTQKSADEFHDDLQKAIEEAIDAFMSKAQSNTPRPTYFIGFMDDRGAALAGVGQESKVLGSITFGRLSDIVRSQTDESLVENGTVTVVKTEECQYYAAVNGWGEENQTGGDDQP